MAIKPPMINANNITEMQSQINTALDQLSGYITQLFGIDGATPTIYNSLDMKGNSITNLSEISSGVSGKPIKGIPVLSTYPVIFEDGDQEEFIPIPGPPGRESPTSLIQAPTVYIEPDVPEDPMIIPGTPAPSRYRVVIAPDGVSITPDSDNLDILYQNNSQAAGTLTINADTGVPVNGQTMLLKLQCANAQTLSWNASYSAGGASLPATTSGAGKIDYFAFIYDSTRSKWDFVWSALGF